MKTPEEIKHALKCCSEMEFPNDCNSCPYEWICTEEYEKQDATLGITLMRDVIAYIAQLEDQISHTGKMIIPSELATPKKENLTSHSERDIVLGCIALIDEVLNGEFAIFEQLELDGFDFDEYKKKSECELGFSLTYFEIVQRLLLYHTTHGGGTSTRAKCRELGFDPNQCVCFHRDRGDEENDE